MMEKIKIGVVGVSRGETYVELFHYSDRSVITAICDTNPENLAASARTMDLPEECCFTDYDSFLQSDIDAVVIGTPIPCHEEQAVKALRAGKHVFSEVTMASTVEGCRAIYEAAKESGKKYLLAENYIYLD